MTMPATLRNERAEYASEADEDLPLATYAGLSIAYAAAVTGFAVWARRRGVRIPARMPTSDLALLAAGTFKLTELVSRDRVTSFARAPFTRYKAPGGGPAVEEAPRPRGVRKGIGDLLTCPWCTAQWVATGWMCGYVVAPRYTRFFASGATVLLGADVLEYVQHAIE
jgi:hypothetical protein